MKNTLGLKLYNGITNIVGGSIGVLFPKASARYRFQRKVLHGVNVKGYLSADYAGSNKGWRPTNKTGDGELRGAFEKILGRARWLADNDPYVDGMVQTSVNNIVRDGIKPQAKVRAPDGQLNKPLNDKIELAFADWADETGWYEKQQLLYRQKLVDGEAIALPVYKPDLLKKGLCPLYIQVLEAEYIDSFIDGKTVDGLKFRRGIGYDEFNIPKVYYLFEGHPKEMMTFKNFRSTPRDAEYVFHIFDQRRSSQHRGVCGYNSLIMRMFNLHEYDDYEMEGCKLENAFGVFRERDENYVGGEDSTVTTTDSTGKVSEYIEPGRIENLEVGEHIVTASHNRPGNNYDMFINKNLMAAGRGVNMSYETFSGDYKGATYSSARTALIEERRSYKVKQGGLNTQLNAPVWKKFLDFSVLAGTLDLPNYFENRIDYQRRTWIAPRWEWVDPVKDAKAAEIKLKMAVTSRTRVCSDTGEDFDENAETLAAEEASLKDKEIPSILGGNSSTTNNQGDMDDGKK